MRLTQQDIEFIGNDLLNRGITESDLANSLTDHICCYIENSNENDFTSAYSNALEKFGNDELLKIQEQIQFINNINKEKIMKKSMFVLGYISLFLVSTGMLFKVQHWPGAAVMLVLGVVLLNFGFLPMYFMDRYKRSLQFN